ncbi:hypothetical protein DXU06_04965 [Bradyrhizobium elkanii]
MFQVAPEALCDQIQKPGGQRLMCVGRQDIGELLWTGDFARIEPPLAVLQAGSLEQIVERGFGYIVHRITKRQIG